MPEDSTRENPDSLAERRVFTIRKNGHAWAVVTEGTIVSTHATRDGAATSCNQLNRAEGWHP
jgi:hypothetical protein